MNPVGEEGNIFNSLFDQVPAKRSGNEEDIAGTIIYLVSRAGVRSSLCYQYFTDRAWEKLDMLTDHFRLMLMGFLSVSMVGVFLSPMAKNDGVVVALLGRNGWCLQPFEY